jgi:hypothetical protein
MSKFGVRISLEGKEAKDAKPEETTIDSDLSSPKIRASANPPHFGNLSSSLTTNVAAGTTINLLTIDHGLGFTPANMMNWSNYARDHYGTGRLDLGPAGDTYYIAYADDKQFRIDFIKTSVSTVDTTGTNYTFRYYIFCESGA